MRFFYTCFALAAAACSYDYRLDGGHSAPNAPNVPVPTREAGARGASPNGTDTPGVAAIDRFKELVVVDATVLQDFEARNDFPGAAFSFRSRFEELAAGGDAAHFTMDWLDSWSKVTSVGPADAPVVPRPAARDLLLAPWSTSTMARAPFRLLAIVNRLDLRDDESGCGTTSGELRFVYTAIDAVSGRSLAMTVIVEIAYPKTRTARMWAEAWHALGSLPFGSDYTHRLAELVRGVTRDADVGRTRVRTNEVAFGAAQDLPWELREFTLTRHAGVPRLSPSLLTSTPRDGLDGSRELNVWLSSHAPRLKAGITDDLPTAMQAGAASVPDPFFRWGVASMIGPDARAAFSLATCNGCHGGERPVGDMRFQHLAPSDMRDAYYGPPSDEGTTRVSRYLHNPGHDDELGRRERSLQTLLNAGCAPSPSGTSDGSGYAGTRDHAATAGGPRAAPCR